MPTPIRTSGWMWNFGPTVCRPWFAGLSKADPAGAAEFTINARKYRQELEQLDSYVHEVIASISPSQRFLVTGHDAFGYFSRRYSIPVQSVQGVTTESEAGLSDITELVSFLVQHRVPALFVETSVSPRNLQAVLMGAAARGHTVFIGGELYSDAMGPSGTYEGTYIGMIDHNSTIVAQALGGAAPARGMSRHLVSNSPAND